MLNPIRLCNDLFNDEELSDLNLRIFTEDHIVRLSNPDNNPGGIYNTLITDTTLKYNAFYGRVTNEMAKKAMAEGTTITRNNAREGEVGALYDTFVTVAATHLTAEFPAEVTAITDLVNAYDTAYTARETVLSQIDTIATGRHEDRKALTRQLTLNFLIIASNNIDNPDRFDDYYNPEYLPISDSLRTFSGIINFNSIITAVEAGIITGSSDLLIENKGTVDLVFSLNDVPGVIHPASEMTIVPGQRHRFTETLPVFTQYYLNIQNPSPDQNGSWHVEVS